MPFDLVSIWMGSISIAMVRYDTNLVCFVMTDGMVVSIIGAAVLFRVDMIGESILSVICMGYDIY